MELSDSQGKIAIGIVVLVVLVVGYFMWKKSGPPAPTIPPGQTLQNPFGTGGQPGPSTGARLPGR